MLQQTTKAVATVHMARKPMHLLPCVMAYTPSRQGGCAPIAARSRAKRRFSLDGDQLGSRGRSRGLEGAYLDMQGIVVR